MLLEYMMMLGGWHGILPCLNGPYLAPRYEYNKHSSLSSSRSPCEGLQQKISWRDLKEIVNCRLHRKSPNEYINNSNCTARVALQAFVLPFVRISLAPVLVAASYEDDMLHLFLRSFLTLWPTTMYIPEIEIQYNSQRSWDFAFTQLQY